MALSEDTWKKSKYTEADLQSVVDECLLQPKEIVQLPPAGSDAVPYECMEELILFQHFVECGLALPACDFLRGLLYHYSIQLHHLIPNSILHIAIFVHLCEAFLGIEAHFNLFYYPFHLKPQPSEKVLTLLGGAGLQGMDKMYIEYKFLTSLSGSKEHWFYVGNHAPALPERINEPPKITHE